MSPEGMSDCAPGPLAEFRAGVLAELPLMLGVVPFGLVYGVLGLAAGLPAWAVVVMCSILFAGSSQIVFVQLWGGGAPALVVEATVGVINLRHVLYSASVAPYLRSLPLRWKLLLSYVLTDEAYAAAIGRLIGGPETPFRHWFLLGTGFTCWASWQLSALAGVLLGAAIPASWSLDFSLALTFLAVVVPALRKRSDVITALTAATVALLAQGLPHKLWIIAAAAAGMAAGAWSRRLDRKEAA
ncbi:MAG TPA: AzlC family ABC transporter permease [Holophaga sp.]|nr:AzlC family ABC transporter permease [Holophaga sp.]